jgi:N-acetylmuramoyl-L-alanine amidase
MAGRAVLLVAVTVLWVIAAAHPALSAGGGGYSDQSLVARTVYFEARSEGFRGMLAVAFVIRNRLKAGGFGTTVAEVVRGPAQFSVWNRDGAARRGKVSADDPHYRMALQAARLALSGAVKDPTCSATYYHERSSRPAWARGMRRVATVGRHVFLRTMG